MNAYLQDLIRAGNETCTKQRIPGLAGFLSINEATGTVSDRRDGAVHAYVSLMRAPWSMRTGAR